MTEIRIVEGRPAVLRETTSAPARLKTTSSAWSAARSHSHTRWQGWPKLSASASATCGPAVPGVSTARERRRHRDPR